MKEVFLELHEVSGYVSQCGALQTKASEVIVREGRKYIQFSYSLEMTPLTRIIKIIQSLALAIFSAFLAFISENFREFFGEVASGKETLRLLAPKEETIPLEDTPHFENRGLRLMVGTEPKEGTETEEKLSSEEEESSEEGPPPLDFNLTTSELSALSKKLHNLKSVPEKDDLKALCKQMHTQICIQKDNEAYLQKEIKKFFHKCSEQLNEVRGWKSVRREFRQQKSNFNLDFFYEMARIYKDYRKIDPQKVLEKVSEEIELDSALYRGKRTKADGLFKEALIVGDYPVEIRRVQGNVRPTMEDTDVALLLKVESKTGEKDIPYFGIFDGHGGQACAQFLKENLHTYVQDELKNQDLEDVYAVTNAFKQSFVKANGAYLEKDEVDGATAIVALIIGDILWVGNAGDSRAVLNLAGEAFQLSLDAKPDNERFRDGIISRGGFVQEGRVMGNLSTARAIGDKYITGVTGRPFVKRFPLPMLNLKESNQLILGCDGLFGVIGSQDAVNLVHGKTALEACDTLITQAFRLGTEDNVTVQVIDLNRTPKKES